MRYRFSFRSNRDRVNMRVARHVGPVKKSRRLPGSFLGEAALLVVVKVLKCGVVGVRAHTGV